MKRMTANQLRRAWLDFFEERGHTAVPSSGLIPHHPTAPLFTNAGMNQFVPYFLGEETPPYRRAASVQKCVRTGDIEIVGTTTRHLTFFEMLGNFSFGDYFKEGAIELAWELSTEVLGFDGDRIWVTVYLDDDEAEEIWRDTIGLPAERIQRLGEADNFWEMQKGQPGPCGPNTELYYDRGPEYGPEGGPAHGGEERYLEFWNLVFMQYNRQPDGSLTELPSRNVDTGAGFDRNLALLQGVDTVFETDVLRPLLACAERLSGHRYTADERADVSLRIMADHARAITFLVSDGVFPSNEGRGYVLRRIIRRAVRHAYLLGVDGLVAPDLVDTTVEVMGEAYPELVKNQGFVRDVVVHEEERFRRTLEQGTTILDAQLDQLGEGDVLPGSVAFVLHDTHGFPLELTQEIAAERGVAVDEEGFAAEMAEQRRRAKEARKAEGADELAERFGELLEQFGPTEFTGREEYESKARVLAVLDDVDGAVSIVLDRTPFYAEAGGQVGDTGTIVSETGRAEVFDTVYGAPGLVRHRARVVEGQLDPGQEVTASIDGDRRDAIRRNHTATHLLHWALREVLGDHVKQQGSLVAPDRLRFDFSHYEALSAEEIARVEDLVNREVLANHPVRHYETTREHAEQVGAIAFFGEKYGDIVRVLEAGPHSTELCGGTHVRALGDIGPIKIISEGSIGSNIRRIEAISGFGPIDRLRREEARINQAAQLLGVAPDDLVDAVERRVAEVKALRDEIKALKRQAATGRAGELAATAVEGVVVARVDGLDRDAVRDLALAVRDQPGIRGVVLGSAPEGGGVAMVAAVRPDSGLHASELIAEAARTVRGGAGKHPELAVAGGKDPSALDAALAQVRAAAGLPAAP
ncbi:alanine--tRNA ligase [Rhabdothermincola sp.]|uniref:alanine--tRNA ligase n=1 Tax=Rhabdothermincola sp. TaxID=2820405 RepID=UPI002FDF9FBC